MTRAAAIFAAGLVLIAVAGPAWAVDSGRARRNDESLADVCNGFKHEYRLLRDKEKHGTATRDDRNRMRDLDDRIKWMCSN